MLVITWAAFLTLILAFVIFRSVPIGPEPVVINNPAKITSPMLRIMGRYAIGVSRFFGPAAPGQQLIDQLDDKIVGTHDDIRAIPIVAEVIGVEKALERLNDLSENYILEDGYDQDVRDLQSIYTQGTSNIDKVTSERLIERHNWFAELALSHELKDSDPLRQQALSPVTRTFVFIIAMACFICLILVVGVGLLITFLILMVQKKLRSRYIGANHDTSGPPSVYLETAFIFLLGVMGFSLLGMLFEEESSWGLLLPWLALPLPFWPLLRGVKVAEWRKALGLHCGGGILREVGAGIVGYITGFPAFFAVLMITLGLSNLMAGVADSDQMSHPVTQQFPLLDSPWKIIAMFLLLCVWAPVLEEMAFRGAFYHHMRRRWHMLIATAIVAFIFAVIHPQGFLAVPVLMTIATTLAFLREWRDSLIAPIVMHACNNGVAFAAMCMLLL
jgi:membrane protease YdiL (CAAX protease family)